MKGTPSLIVQAARRSRGEESFLVGTHAHSERNNLVGGPSRLEVSAGRPACAGEYAVGTWNGRCVYPPCAEP